MNPSKKPPCSLSAMKFSLIAIALLFLASCRIVITTDGTGYILSASGDYDCEQSRCVSKVTESITETFTAIPLEGYRFVRWQGLCILSPTAVCKATVFPLPEEHSQYDGDIQLFAEFEPNSVVRKWYRDSDGDGYGSSASTITSSARPEDFVVNDLDCDDSDADIRPWVKEREDGRDNNCDGKIDEGFVDLQFYLDSDGDGFGDPAAGMVARRTPQGYVENDLDCNDADAQDNPNAPELLDSRDNNCDGSIDENATTYFRDLDGDGFGSSVASIESIDPIAGYVLVAGDCDDNNNRISPASPEEFDSVDNDCDNLIDEGFSQRTYYRDADNDGYGDRADSLLAVELPAGYVTNSIDNCPAVSNPSQADSDADSIGDACDSQNNFDLDNDGINATADNCPEHYNPSQSDGDGDGLGDACDSVDNNDNSGAGSASGGCTISPEAQSMLDAVNAFRAGARECGSYGAFNAVPALSWSCELEAAALSHSADMANNNFFSHTGADGSSAGDRATAAGYSWSAWGENIAAGSAYQSVGAVLQGWIDSPGHCANLMNASVSNLGAARYSNSSSTYGVYWTQVFGRPR